MRLAVMLVLAALAVLTARSAGATGLCDPAGHFCVQVDTTTATVCTPLRPGGLRRDTCEASDGDVRKAARRLDEKTHGASRAIDALVVRFEEWSAGILLVRRAAEPEVDDGGAAEALKPFTQLFDHAAELGWLVEEVTPPTLTRVNGVQVARLERRLSIAGIAGATITRSIAYEVRARNAAYLVRFEASEADAARLAAMANAVMSTLDALPIQSGPGPTEGLTWLVRGVVAAVLLVGLGLLVGRVRRGTRGAGGHDLWPR